MVADRRTRFELGLFGIVVLISFCSGVESKCTKGCDLALASYYVWQGSNISFITQVLSTSDAEILKYNPSVPNKDSVLAFERINVPFRCDCINGEFLGRVFSYTVSTGNTYETIARLYYSNLTTAEWIQRFNSYDPANIPAGSAINVTVNCSCGDPSVSKAYGLFVTYPLRPEDSLSSIASQSNLSSSLLQSYNPNANFSAGSGLVYIPGKDENGNYPRLTSSKGLSIGAIAGVSIAGVAGVLLFAGCLYVGYHRRKKVKGATLLPSLPSDNSTRAGLASGGSLDKAGGSIDGSSPRLTGITVDKSVEFSYEELAKATDDFSLSNKIGQGGFGSVYYAELRGEVCSSKYVIMSSAKTYAYNMEL